MRHFVWKKNHQDEIVVSKLQKELGINKVLCSILVSRGIKNYNEAKKFFRPKKTDLYSPWLFKDMDKGVDRLIKAINENQKILLVGDYDVDGITSTTILYEYLKSCSDNINFHIPSRFKEGYGLSKKIVEEAIKNKCFLIITMDCGISSIEIVEQFCSQIDFIILDHHLPGEKLPQASAVINPKRKDCQYPFKQLPACGIVFKYIQALNEKKLLYPNERLWQDLQLVCLAIGADLVEMKDENKTMMALGLQSIIDNPIPPIKSLIDLSKLNKKDISTEQIVFGLGPRINALGRIEDGAFGVHFLIEKNEKKCFEMASIIEKKNNQRKSINDTIFKQAKAMLEADEKIRKKKSQVLYRCDWHLGVLGIVASRMVDCYYKPTIILSKKEGNILTGSARSVKGFDIFLSMKECSKYLETFGGHQYAAGLTLKEENLEAFIIAFEAEVSKNIKPESLQPKIIIDAEVTFERLTNKFVNIIEQMKPFGPDSLCPKFLIRNVRLHGEKKIFKEKYLKVTFRQSNISLPAIFFYLPKHYESMSFNNEYDVIVEVTFNIYKEKKNINLKVYDIELSNAMVKE